MEVPMTSVNESHKEEVKTKTKHLNMLKGEHKNTASVAIQVMFHQGGRCFYGLYESESEDSFGQDQREERGCRRKTSQPC